MTSTDLPTDPMELAQLADVPEVRAAFELYQEARNQQSTCAGGPSAGRVAVEQTRAAWVSALRKAHQSL